ncbi:hypothetical protein [Kribbella kalugense]|uniref:Lipoprotein n=1 Tax=Kribbella kalugense TaxID=2512221 RepID=A0A4R7ZQH0_9ACTN|nr:hypothetical protein [Kribbella kalugense]TDW18838.1 hypothetical protein EV650_5439 [Kribbella kalugense]
MEELRHTGFRILAAIALVLGYSATVACSPGPAALPVAPSPGLTVALPSATPPPKATPGPGGTTPGIQLTVVPQRDGSFDVTENVMLPQATDILSLQLPTSGINLPGMMSPTTPKVTNLKVLADNQFVPVENSTVAGSGDLPLTVSATRVQLTYRLSGSTILASPSVSTRASSAIRPLTSGADAALPTDIKVTSGLLNAVCPLMAETRCAVGDPPDLTIQTGLPASKALVVLQLDLPR